MRALASKIRLALVRLSVYDLLIRLTIVASVAIFLFMLAGIGPFIIAAVACGVMVAAWFHARREKQ